ncbi:DivIVA domain-containing protein [Mycoplasma sp. 1932B]|uniref:DivIVA domain-containing protein n=1 Tax=unclassified Mycoplasma TaxID=2683645 RepID=UPI003AAC26A6
MKDKVNDLCERIKNQTFSLNLEGYNKKEVDDFMQLIFANLIDEQSQKEALTVELEKYKELYQKEILKNQMLEEENNRLSKEVEKIYE